MDDAARPDDALEIRGTLLDRSVVLGVGDHGHDGVAQQPRANGRQGNRRIVVGVLEQKELRVATEAEAREGIRLQALGALSPPPRMSISIPACDTAALRCASASLIPSGVVG